MKCLFNIIASGLGLICLSPLLYSIQLTCMKSFRDLANWYFSRSALLYWSILLLDCMFVVFAGVLAFTVHHGSEQTLSVLGSLA